MRTGNPALNDKTFENFGVYRRDLAAEQHSAGTMTINGTAQKTMFLLLLAMGSACFTWSKTFTGLKANPAAAMPWAFGGAIISLITALVICFKHTWAPGPHGYQPPRPPTLGRRLARRASAAARSSTGTVPLSVCFKTNRPAQCRTSVSPNHSYDVNLLQGTTHAESTATPSLEQTW